ncbi:single-stranded DNA-binding protein [Actinomyces faecalis]|uniref:single-stranded DNA-binding protein n=1 Tax=Actinomyces faecalis TaxID=2722820 RepID=UPI001555899C|nr:single-stranded DNA-binding protein [Actinomyces faecalis]
MAATVTLTGNLGSDPDLRYTPNGRPVLQLSVAATPSHYDKQAGQWVQDGDPLWIRAALWGEEHTHLADILHKGDRVTLTGDLMRREFTRRDGTPGESLELKFPRLLGIIPPRPQPGQPTGGSTRATQGATSPAASAAWGQAPAGGQDDDPWATSGTSSGNQF